MLKLTTAVLAVALAGAASAGGWKSLRVDASSEEAFEQSLAVFKDELSYARQYVFGEALKDIWVKGATAAEAEQREYTADDYYRQIHGLSYEQVVTFTDPTGEVAKSRFRFGRNLAASTEVGNRRPAQGPNYGARPTNGWGSDAYTFAQQVQQCKCAAPNGPQGN